MYETDVAYEEIKRKKKKEASLGIANKISQNFNAP